MRFTAKHMRQQRANQIHPLLLLSSGADQRERGRSAEEEEEGGSQVDEGT